MDIGKSIKAAFARLRGASEPQAPHPPATVSVDRKDLTLCVIDEFETKKRSNEFIAGRWAEIANILEETFSVAKPMNDLETGLVDSVRTVERAIREAGTFDARIEIPQKTVDTLVRTGALAYNAKNYIMARIGDLSLSLPMTEPPVVDPQRDAVYIPPRRSSETDGLLERHDRLAMFALKSREALTRYSADAAPGSRPGAEI